VIIGLLAGFFAVAYSGGPIPLGSKALGDLLVFIFFGLVAVTTTYYLQTKTLTSQVFIAAVPIGLFIMAILIINNYRDYESDKKAGKITLAVLLGKQVTKLYFIVVILAGYMVAFILYVNILLIDLNLVILPLLTLPIHIFIIKELFRSEGKALNKLLALTARTSLLYSIFFSIGLLI
jgi:1,4-dihydroxy-2-naphthoate octaprenyltransferase